MFQDTNVKKLECSGNLCLDFMLDKFFLCCLRSQTPARHTSHPSRWRFSRALYPALTSRHRVASLGRTTSVGWCCPFTVKWLRASADASSRWMWVGGLGVCARDGPRRRARLVSKKKCQNDTPAKILPLWGSVRHLPATHCPTHGLMTPCRHAQP